ncbi:MAG: class I SAM-dependent methyltransferase [Candidatus Margulisbacteria bacterium]|jgi:SAM-dependent methyltransferase|nr:class I SAM-dependent methyltransferase [Candidatus Margulisiibacteriota bacterium]
MIAEKLARYDLFRRALRAVLPTDANYWRVYAPVIKILKDSHEHQLIREKVNRSLHLNGQDTVLEAGCGNALWLAEISSKVKLAVGLDHTGEMLAVAKKNLPGALFVQGDLNAPLPIQSGALTKIGSILVEGYLHNDQLSREENFRALAPGGLIAVVTPRRGARFFKVLAAEARHRQEEQSVLRNLRKLPLALIAIIFGKIAELKAVIGDWHFYDQAQLRERYQKAGFEIVACESVYADQAWLLIARKPDGVDGAGR